MPDGPFARGAPVWRAAGWQGTLWLPLGKKHPPPTDYTGALGLDADDDTVAYWAVHGTNHAPDAPQVDGNLGIRLPMGVCGIDVDWYKPDGPESFKELVRVCGHLEPTWRSSSRTDPRSGIYLYRVPVGVKLRGNPLPAVEVIQFHHRYMVTWPSLHPDGGQYRLTGPDGSPGVTPPRIDELPWLPEPWLKQLVEPERPQGVSVPKRNTGEWSGAVAKAYADTQIGLGGAGRHDVMLKGVDALTRLDHLGHPGAREAIERLGEQFLATVVDRSSLREAQGELQRILDGAERTVSSTPSYRPPWSESLEAPRPLASPRAAPGGFQAPTVPTDPATALEAYAGWDEADTRALLDAGLEADVAELLIRDDGASLLYPGKVNTLFGSSGSGKTWLALLAIAQEVKAGRHCLYLDWEDDPRTFIRRLLLLGCTDEQVITYGHYISPTMPATATVVAWLVGRQLRLVVLDSTGESIAAHGGNENDGTDVASWMGLLPRPLARAGACVLLVDHVPHAAEQAREIGSQRKRAAISGASYEVVQLEAFSKERSGKMVVRTGKDRGGNYARGQAVADVTVEPGDDRLTILLTVPRWVDAQGKNLRPTALMERLSRYIELNPDVTYSVLKTSAVRGNKRAKDQALAQLIDEGYVEVGGGEDRSSGSRTHRSVRQYREDTDPLLKDPDELE